MDFLIFVSMEDWDAIWRRNQFVCAELSRRHPRLVILFVGLQRNIWRSLRQGKWRDVLRDPTRPIEGFPNIVFTSALRVAPERFRWGARFNEWLTLRQIRKAAKKLGVRQPVLWLNPHYAVHLVGKLGESQTVYDITDDWELLTQSPEMRRRVQEQDAALGRLADAVIVCSEQLRRDKERKFNRPVHLIPNGVDADHYRAVLDDGAGPLPEAAQSWPKPVLGYTGTVHSDRVDVALLVALAKAFPQGSVVLIGPNLLSPAEQAQLHACGNVRLPGPVPYAEIPRWMRAFDVCIVPHRVTPFTESLNPIKLWEYLAAGKPIVATPVAGFRDYPQHVRLAEGPAAFAKAVEEALNEPREAAARRQAEARRHAWSSRVDQIEAALRERPPAAEAPNP